MRTSRYMYVLAALGLIALMVTPECALSKGLFDNDSTYVIPYEEGDEERIPSAAASLSLLECRRTYNGALYTLEVSVFETTHKPVYAIQIIGLDRASLEAVDCPAGWSSKSHPQSLAAADVSSGGLSFYTDSRPILPGSNLSGFQLRSSSNSTAVRYYALDEKDMLLGKVTRTVLSCPTGTVPGTWGAIKSLYR